MTILGIETSTAVCSVGLANEFDLRAEKSIIETHIHSEKLLTLIQELCDEQKMKLSQLDGVAVSIGPGSFTGLRIGLSTAKGLCFALEKPLIAVSTFASIAKSVTISHPEYARIIVCIDAKQREYYIGVYEHRQRDCPRNAGCANWQSSIGACRSCRENGDSNRPHRRSENGIRRFYNC